MKRYLGPLIVLLALLLLVPGCRRRASGPPKPLNVYSEKDVILPPSDKEMFEGMKPTPKRRSLEINLFGLQKKPGGVDWDFPLEALDLDVDVQLTGAKDAEESKIVDKATNQLAKVRDALSQQKEALQKAERVVELKETGLLYADFCKTTPAKSYTLDNFESFVRRAKKPKLYKELQGGKIEIITEVDWSLPNQLIAYLTEDDQVLLSNQSLISMKRDAMKEVVELQEMRVFWLNYTAYLKASPEVDKRSTEKFRKYLKANASPSLVKLVEDQVLTVGNPRTTGDPRLPGSNWIACQAKRRNVSTDVNAPVLKHLAIALNGATGLLSPEEAQTFIVKR